MSIPADISSASEQRIQTRLDEAKLATALTDVERVQLVEEIKQALNANNAILVAHYYVDSDIQKLAEETGGIVADSLEMARFGARHDATTLIVAGVRFMGETAKILNPEKRVLMPELDAACSLDLGCPADEFSAFCDQHPDRTAVVYANTSAEVKARADWVVTSGIALPVAQHLASLGEKVLWAPDKHLGNYVRSESGADMILWPGSCVVHDAFRADELQVLKAQHPDAEILVHPESPEPVVAMADVVGSTTALIKAAQESVAPELIVATDRGIFYKMKQAAPDKILLEAPTRGLGATCESCSHCPWMAMNGLRNTLTALNTGSGEIEINPDTGERARVPLQRMMDFAEMHRLQVKGNA